MKTLLVLAAISIISVSCSRKIQPAGTLVHENKSYNNTIRVMCYNVHHCNPPSKPGVIDIDAVAIAIQDQNPDLVALQEIDVNTGRSGRFNQAEELARKLNMKFFFGKAIDHDGGDYGVAILSKYPVSEPRVFRLPTEAGTNGEPRVLTTVKVMLPEGKSIRFGSTHLDAQKEPVNRELQIKEINRISAGEVLPFILAGDFNAAPGSGVINHLDQRFMRTCQSCEPTVPVNNPSKTIDFISFSPALNFKVISHAVVPEHYASDHLPVIAVLQYIP